MNLQLSARKTTTMTTATTTTTSMGRVGVKPSSRARKENTVRNYDLNMTLMCRNLSEENIIRTRNLKFSFEWVNQLMEHLRIGRTWSVLQSAVTVFRL